MKFLFLLLFSVSSFAQYFVGTRESVEIKGVISGTDHLVFTAFAEGYEGEYVRLLILDLSEDKYVYKETFKDHEGKNPKVEVGKKLAEYLKSRSKPNTLKSLESLGYNLVLDRMASDISSIYEFEFITSFNSSLSLYFDFRKASSEYCSYLLDYGIEPMLIDMKVSFDRFSPEKKTIYSDSKLPESRGCPYDYILKKVYLSDNGIITFFDKVHVGFEAERDTDIFVISSKISN